MSACPPLAAEGAFLSSLLRHIDCQGQTIGAGGYQALADPGSPVSLALTGVLTIFIALFGLRMVLGAAPGVRETVMGVVKIGIVLVIATSWPAYRTVIYDVIVQGPGQLSRTISGAAALPGAQGELTGRLQAVDSRLTRLTTLGSGRSDLTAAAARGPDGSTVAQERAPITDDLAFGGARVTLLSSLVAAFALVRLGAGVLLALAPLFAGLLLFDMARPLFAGWLRALAFTLLASIALTVIAGVQVALLEPWLSRLLQLRTANIVTPQAPTELLVLCLAFALALAATLALLLRVAFTVHVRLDVRVAGVVDQVMNGLMAVQGGAGGTRSPAVSAAAAPARAVAVANALSATMRRETGATRAAVTLRRLAGAPAPQTAATGRGGSAPAGRRGKTRTSLASSLRDRRS